MKGGLTGRPKTRQKDGRKDGQNGRPNDREKDGRKDGLLDN